MTREKAHNYMWYENDKNPSIRWGHHNTINNLHKTLIDQIYDDFEVNTNLLLKANEEEISRHFNECEKYEAQLKAKNEDLKLAMDLSKHMLDELKTERGIKEYLAKQLKAKENDLEHQDMIIKCLSMDLDNKEKLLKAKDEEIERLFGLIKSLWQIIDDIDTYGDMAKSDDVLFRSLVEKKQKERWELPISTDGYSIYLKDNKLHTI